MDPVARFTSEIAAMTEHERGRDELQRLVERSVSTFIGRVGVTETGFAPREEVADAIRQARARLADKILGDRPARHVVLLELDKALSVIGRNALPPRTLT